MKRLLLICGVVVGLAPAQTANAGYILLNGPNGNVIIPANESAELATLAAVITAYNAANNTNLPAPGPIDLTPQLVGGATSPGSGHANLPSPTPLSITIDFGLERETYALFTWDGPNGGTLIYYVGDETGPVTFESPTFPTGRQYGLSHYMFTGPSTVPDGGMTLVLLGGAVAGLGVLRRRFGS
jgi:VPDSG-CTERM motif